MNILRFAVLFACLLVFTLSGLVIRNDPKNEHPLATVTACVSMAMLIVWAG